MEFVLGTASVRRVGRLVPVSVFEGKDGRVLARLGRGGWFRVFFGTGRRVELPDGSEWRLTAAGAGPYMVPMVTSAGGKLAVAAPHGKRSYGINGRSYAYNMYPAGRAGLRRWSLREHETELGTFESNSMFADHPIPLAAALLCFTLIKYGVPGDTNFGVPQFRWG